MSRDVALLVPGAGSTPEAVIRLLGPAVPAGAEARAVDPYGHVDDVVARLDRAVHDLEAAGDRLVLAAGISLGAHAVAFWAARQRGPLPRLVLAMPAWTGPPDDVAAATSSSADEIERHGTGPVLERLHAPGSASARDWVVDELVRAWTDADPALLADALRQAARSPAPTLDDLARLRAPVVVVALADDPLHPEGVARAWAGAVPGARLAVVGRHTPAVDRGALGRAAAEAASGSR